MKKKILIFFVMFTMLIVVSAVTASSASAGGRIYNNTNSTANVYVTDDWVYKTNQRILWPGMGSTNYYADTDGFKIPNGCWARDQFSLYYVDNHWYKITDIVELHLRVSCY